MHTRSNAALNDSLKRVKEDYEQKLSEKDRQVKEYIQKHQQVNFLIGMKLKNLLVNKLVYFLSFFFFFFFL